MNEEILAYFEYLQKFKELEKPPMPKFDLLAYNDNEYMLAMKELEKEFDSIDDLQPTLKHLQGEQWK